MNLTSNGVVTNDNLPEFGNIGRTQDLSFVNLNQPESFDSYCDLDNDSIHIQSFIDKQSKVYEKPNKPYFKP